MYSMVERQTGNLVVRAEYIRKRAYGVEKSAKQLLPMIRNGNFIFCAANAKIADFFCATAHIFSAAVRGQMLAYGGDFRPF